MAVHRRTRRYALAAAQRPSSASDPLTDDPSAPGPGDARGDMIFQGPVPDGGAMGWRAGMLILRTFFSSANGASAPSSPRSAPS